MNLNYSYGATHQNNGNISQISNGNDSTRSVSYQYDQLNRVSQAQTSTWGDTYGYDSWGNLLSKTKITGLNGESMSYTANNKNQLVPAGGTAPYDAAGQVTSDSAGNSYSYDVEGRVTQVNNGSYVTSYLYDGNGERVSKSSSVASKLYWYGPDGRLLNESDSAGNVTDRYGWFNGEMVGRLDSAGNVLHFMYHDHLGSTRLVVSSAGQIQDDLDYYPFGGVVPKQQSSGNMYNFTGYESDPETGTTEHAWFRNTDTGSGRFMRPDPSGLSYQLANPQSLNRYTYTMNRPTVGVDPTGLHCVDYMWCGGDGCANNPVCQELHGNGFGGYGDYDAGCDTGCNSSFQSELDLFSSDWFLLPGNQGLGSNDQLLTWWANSGYGSFPGSDDESYADVIYVYCSGTLDALLCNVDPASLGYIVGSGFYTNDPSLSLALAVDRTGALPVVNVLGGATAAATLPIVLPAAGAVAEFGLSGYAPYAPVLTPAIEDAVMSASGPGAWYTYVPLVVKTIWDLYQ